LRTGRANANASALAIRSPISRAKHPVARLPHETMTLLALENLTTSFPTADGVVVRFETCRLQWKQAGLSA
jgi:hypothetical protein